MSKVGSEDANRPESTGVGIDAAPARQGMSPYATGAGGVTFERKAAVQYLAHLLVGDSANELGDGRRVVSVAFQPAPVHSVDDLVVSAARPDELQASLVMAIAVRRSPNLVVSDESSDHFVRVTQPGSSVPGSDGTPLRPRRADGIRKTCEGLAAHTRDSESRTEVTSGRERYCTIWIAGRVATSNVCRQSSSNGCYFCSP